MDKGLIEGIVIAQYEKILPVVKANGEMFDIYDEPLIGIGAADDPLFLKLQREHCVGAHHMLPTDWLEGAKSVISVFFPFSQQVKHSNSLNGDIVSEEWLLSRYHGQNALADVCAGLAERLNADGYEAVPPFMDKRYMTRFTNINNDTNVNTTNWSERHTAFVCGLGTFGLSAGLITKKGVAGRFCSVVTDAEIKPDIREYTGYRDYCIKCMRCARRCVPKAITMDAKDHVLCGKHLTWASATEPVYGCGKCQVDVPCMDKIPGR